MSKKKKKKKTGGVTTLVSKIKCREPVKEVIYRKKEWGHRAFKRVKHVYR